jgi:MerR family copper efflux transcriptional regulator
MRITEAAQRLGISARMLRYRESLGLLPPVRSRPATRRTRSTQPVLAVQPVLAATTAQPVLAATPVLPAQPVLPVTPARRSPRAAAHRQFAAADLDAVALGITIERRYDISPAALAFGLRVLADPAARAEVAELGRRIGRIKPLPAMAMDFEKERAARFLGTS